MKNFLKKTLLFICSVVLVSCSTESVDETIELENVRSVPFSEQYNYYGEIVSVDYTADGNYVKEGLSENLIKAIDSGVFYGGSTEGEWYLFNNEDDLVAWNATQLRSKKGSTSTTFFLYDDFNQNGNRTLWLNVQKNKFSYIPGSLRSKAKSYVWGFNNVSTRIMSYGVNGSKTKSTYRNDPSASNLRSANSSVGVVLDYIWRVKWN